MKVRKSREKGLYMDHLQRGGLAIYKGERLRGGRFSLRFLGPIGKFVGKTALKLGKSIFKKVAPKVGKIALDTGQDVLSGRSDWKTAVREGARKGRKQLTSGTRKALIQELTQIQNKQKGKGGLMRKRVSAMPKYSW